ncbi:hypothetical protein V8E51_005205 [Hyaloscypha variabilis]
MAYNSPAAPFTYENTVSDSLDIEISHDSSTMTSSPPASISSVEHTTSETAQSFTPFPKLSQELMDMVWSFALSGPRIVAFESEMAGDAARDYGAWLKAYIQGQRQCDRHGSSPHLCSVPSACTSPIRSRFF